MLIASAVNFINRLLQVFGLVFCCRFVVFGSLVVFFKYVERKVSVTRLKKKKKKAITYNS